MKNRMPDNHLTPENDFYAGFLYNTFLDPFTFRIRHLIETQVDKGADVLDVGCGTGRLLRHLSLKIHTGVGVDLADRMINHASRTRDKQGLTNLSFALADAADLSRYEENSFDFGMLTLVLHELPPDARMPAVNELVRVSRRQIITDYAVRPGPVPTVMMNLLEASVGIRHFHDFRSYINNGGALSLIDRAGLRVDNESSALMGMVRIWTCKPRTPGPEKI